MLTLKILVSFALISGSIAFATYWNNVAQPRMAEEQSMRQMEIHQDGTGDRLAEQRRVITSVYTWPPQAVYVAVLLVVVCMFVPEMQRGLKKLNTALMEGRPEN